MSGEGKARAEELLGWLEATWPELGPWAPVEFALPAGGPQAAAAGPNVIALGYGAGRRRAELAGLAHGHPWQTRGVQDDPRALLVPRRLGPLEDAAGALPVPEERGSLSATRRTLIAELAPDLSAVKALTRLGVRRRHADRWLDAEVHIETRVGPSLGGVAAGFLALGPDGPMSFRWDRACASGWWALDLAGLAPTDEAACSRHRQRHASVAEDADAADAAFELAWVVACLREARHGDTRATECLLAHLRPTEPPRSVRVWIDGPPWVAEDLWEAPGAEVSAARARWLKAELDGLSVGGGVLRVRTEPPVRAGRRPPPREPRAVRRRRLFLRWDDGIRTDDEGLVGITPEAIARALARGASGVVLDGTCGVGALAIAHARESAVERVIAVDISRERLEMARHNAALYGVVDRIEFVHGDVLEVLKTRRADRLVLDPPWGGRDYDRGGLRLAELPMDVARALDLHEGPVGLKLPRSLDLRTLPEAAWDHSLIVDARGVVKMIWAFRGPA